MKLFFSWMHFFLLTFSSGFAATAASEIGEIFDVVESPIPGVEEKGYYIKKKFYTEKNLQEGEAFFLLNCASCHGNEGDGSGMRAAIMQDAKPRMFTNFDWESSRDDMRLLRSIKYGVPGTSMTPWGDFTTALQRMQLVMFIRSLNDAKELQENLDSQLYETFHTQLETVQEARRADFKKLEKTEADYRKAKKARQNLAKALEKGKNDPAELTVLYTKELELEAELKKEEEKDKKYTDLMALIEKELDLYRMTGMALNNAYKTDPINQQFLLVMKEPQGGNVTLENGKLSLSDEDSIEGLDAQRRLLEMLDEKKAQGEKEEKIVQGKVQSEETSQQLQHLHQEMQTHKKMEKMLENLFMTAKQIREKKKALLSKMSAN